MILLFFNVFYFDFDFHSILCVHALLVLMDLCVVRLLVEK